MAVIPYVVLVNKSRLKVIQWRLMARTDTGQPYEFSAHYADKSVQVDGTFGVGGKCAIEGSNYNTSPVWAVLNDAQGNAAEIIAANIKQLLEITKQIRPNISAGDGTTALNVTMVIATSA
jgi:hypothetical protein